MIKSIYIVGSLRNPAIPKIANKIEALGIEAFADWYGAGERADDAWKEYEIARGRTYQKALNGYAAKHIFEFDLKHIQRCDAALLVAPAGKSGHLELGYATGLGKPTFYLMDNPDRWDIMLQFAFVNGGEVFFSEKEMLDRFAKIKPLALAA